MKADQQRDWMPQVFQTEVITFLSQKTWQKTAYRVVCSKTRFYLSSAGGAVLELGHYGILACIAAILKRVTTI